MTAMPMLAIATVMFTQEEYPAMQLGKVDAARARSRHRPVGEA